MSYGQDPYGQQGGYGGQQPYSGAGYGGQPAAGNIDEIGLSVGKLVLAFILCWPFAIPALISNNRVKDRLAQGDAHGAQSEGVDAKKWAKIAYIVGGIIWGLDLLCCIGYVVFIVILGAGVAGSSSYSSYVLTGIGNALSLLPF